jgi:hypothetical protein
LTWPQVGYFEVAIGADPIIAPKSAYVNTLRLLQIYLIAKAFLSHSFFVIVHKSHYET